MRRDTADIHATDPDRPGEHRIARQCPCGPRPFRDLSTGALRVWVHRTPPKPTTPSERAARRDFEAFGSAPWVERSEDETR